MPEVSIITINYNDKLGLQKTIESVAAQKSHTIEHIVVDGASTDGSVTYLESCTQPIQFISKKDTGVYQAMNRGIALAKGTYVLFLNSGDTFFENDVLQKILPLLATEIDIYYGNLLFITEKKNFIREYPDELTFSYFKEFSLPHPASFIKRELFSTLFNYTETYKIVSDWEFFICAICKYNVPYKHLPMTISKFGLDGMSNNPANKHLIAAERKAVLQKHFPAFIKDLETLTSLQSQSDTKEFQLLTQVRKSTTAKRMVIGFMKLLNRFVKK